MVGYNLIHNPALWELVIAVIALPIGLCSLVVILLEYFYNSWYEDMMGTTPNKPGYDYGRANTNWGRFTDPYYDKENTVIARGVPVLYYRRVAEGWEAVLTNTLDCPKTVDWQADKFSWIWIAEAKRIGWKQANPPADPTIIASIGMWAHIDRILSEEQGVKTGGVNARMTIKRAQIAAKSSLINK